jgi:flagellar hook-associated protein 2
VHAVSDTPVTINVEQDFKRAVDAAKGFVTDFNSMLTRIDELGSYDLEAEKKGVLFGESSVRTIENRLLRELSRSSTEFGELTRLTRVGISFDAGGKLQFDESTFREKLEEDPEGIAEFFTDADGGRAVRFKEVVESITGASGVIKRRSNALEDQQELLNDRVDRMNALLEQRRERLLREFIQMEEILGNLNSQQESLSQMGSLSAG